MAIKISRLIENFLCGLIFLLGIGFGSKIYENYGWIGIISTIALSYVIIILIPDYMENKKNGN